MKESPIMFFNSEVGYFYYSFKNAQGETKELLVFKDKMNILTPDLVVMIPKDEFEEYKIILPKELSLETVNTINFTLFSVLENLNERNMTILMIDDPAN